MFFENNFREGNFFLGSTVRDFFVLKHEKGSATSYFLTSKFREIDHRKLFHNSRGKIPFIFFNRHMSRTKIRFIDCAIQPSHNSVSCARVPTTLFSSRQYVLFSRMDILEWILFRLKSSSET